MTLLQETKAIAKTVDYYKNAKDLGLTDREVIQRAADDYCAAVDANNDAGKNKFMAVLMVKFWREIGKMQKKCKSVTLLEYGDYYDKLYYCIETAMGYRAWQDPDKKTNAQACINSTISSRGAAEILYQSNLDKGRANINAASLDTPVNSGDSDDHEVTLGDLLTSDEKVRGNGDAESVIQSYADNGKLVEAIIIDNIAFGESTKVTSEATTYTTYEKNIKTGELEEVECKGKTNYREFWAFKLVRLLNSLDSSYVNYFMNKYKVNSTELEAAIKYISEANNQKLYRQLDGCIAGLKKLIMNGTISIQAN